jgi:hypothetical protein
MAVRKIASEHAPVGKYGRGPLRADLQQLLAIISGSIPHADAQGRSPEVDARDRALIEAYGYERWLGELALRNLHEELDQVGREFRLREALETYAPSEAVLEGRHEINLGELVRDLSPTAGNKMSPLFQMLLLATQSPEDIAQFRELARRFHGAMNDYRRTHSAIKPERGRPSEEARTWLVGKLLRIFARRAGFLEASLTRQEFAELRNLFMVWVTARLGVPMSRDAIRKRRQRAELPDAS